MNITLGIFCKYLVDDAFLGVEVESHFVGKIFLISLREDRFACYYAGRVGQA